MGELVSGIGDEVLLFATFLALSACMYVSILLYKSYGNQQNTEQAAPEANFTQEVQVTDNSDAEDSEHETTVSPSQSERQHSTQSGLRSRFHSTLATSPSNTTQPDPQTIATEAQADTGNSGQEESSSQEESRDRLISIRLINSNDTRTVQVAANTTLQELRRSYFRDEVAQARPVRFIFQGRVLVEDSATLMSLGITDGRAVHIHIGMPRPPGEVPPVGQDVDQDLDLSRLFVPLFGVILGLVWVCLLMYPYVFNLMTKLFLFLLSLAYVVLSYVTNFT